MHQQLHTDAHARRKAINHEQHTYHVDGRCRYSYAFAIGQHDNQKQLINNTCVQCYSFFLCLHKPTYLLQSPCVYHDDVLVEHDDDDLQNNNTNKHNNAKIKTSNTVRIVVAKQNSRTNDDDQFVECVIQR